MVREGRHERRRPATADDGSAIEMKRITKVITVTTSVFLVMDLITTFESVLVFYDAEITSELFSSQTLKEVLRHSSKVRKLLSYQLPTACLMWFVITISCCYPILCYLLFHTTYRNTLKKVAKGWYNVITGSPDQDRAENVSEELRMLRVNSAQTPLTATSSTVESDYLPPYEPRSRNSRDDEYDSSKYPCNT